MANEGAVIQFGLSDVGNKIFPVFWRNRSIGVFLKCPVIAVEALGLVKMAFKLFCKITPLFRKKK